MLETLSKKPSSVRKVPKRRLDESEGEDEDEKENIERQKALDYRSVSEDIEVYESEYSKCIKDIDDDKYTSEEVDLCVGKNFLKVVLDIKYITLKVMAKADSSIRKLMIENCYKKAMAIEEFSMGCDVLEKDLLDMMWNGLEFVELVEINKDKYLVEYGKVPPEVFNNIKSLLEDISEEFFQLLDEIDSHKDIIILRLKNLIDDRTKLIMEKEQDNEDFVTPSEPDHPTIEHIVHITETVTDDASNDNKNEEAGEEEEEDRKRSRKIKQLQKNNNRSQDASVLAKKEVMDRVKRNKEFRKTMVNKLNEKTRQQLNAPSKNVHTTRFHNSKE